MLLTVLLVVSSLPPHQDHHESHKHETRCVLSRNNRKRVSIFKSQIRCPLNDPFPDIWLGAVFVLRDNRVMFFCCCCCCCLTGAAPTILIKDERTPPSASTGRSSTSAEPCQFSKWVWIFFLGSGSWKILSDSCLTYFRFSSPPPLRLF